MEAHKHSIGDEVLVFDGGSWSKVGDQPDGNKQFWKKAKIFSTRYSEDNESLADVLFIDEQKKSFGHFQDGIKQL